MVKFVMATCFSKDENDCGKKAVEYINNAFGGMEQQVVVLDLENMSEETVHKFVDMGAIDCFSFTTEALLSSRCKDVLVKTLGTNTRLKKNIKFMSIYDSKSETSIDDAKLLGRVLLDESCGATLSHIDINANENLFIQNLQGIRNSAVREREMLQEREKYILDFTSKIVGDIETGKDEYTARHIRSVCAIAEAIAKRMDISEQDIDVLKVGALLHDVGKQDVSDSVLKKPSRLTNEEFMEMKAHVLLGEVELNQYNLGEYERAKLIAAQHHEKYDGTGYPRGLQGEEIDILSRIVSLSDATQAMFGRSYQSGKTKEDLIGELKRCAGTQFDPKMVDVLCDILETEPQTIYVSYGEDNKIEYNVPTTEELIGKAARDREKRREAYFPKFDI